MHALTEWFVKNPVASNLLMLFIIVAGIMSVQTIRIEGFPSLPPNAVSVTTIYPGADVEQVDRGISQKIERSLEGMPGIKRISSISMEGVSTLYVEKNSGFDIDRFQNEIQSRVNAIASLPQMAERPLVVRDEFKVEALLVQVYGDTDTQTLQKVSRDVKEELLAHANIAKLTPFGLQPYEIRIELDDTRIQSYGVTPEMVTQAIQNSALDYRTGALKSQSGRIIIKADEQAFHYEDFAQMPLLALEDGTRVVLGDVAQIIDGFEEEELFARYQGKSSVGMLVYTSKKGHLLQVSKAAHEVVEQLRPGLPHGVSIDVWGESSLYMQDRLKLLAINALQGLMIVFVILALFLNIKLAFWVAMGIPISIAGTLALLGDAALGYSLNDITTFGLILVLGIIVDDAVVVGESIYASKARGGSQVTATIEGTNRVSTATVFGALTSMAAFYPLLMIDNDLAKIFAGFSVVAITALAVSLVESKVILPSHLAHIDITKESVTLLGRFWSKMQKGALGILDTIDFHLYQRLLKLALSHRYASLVIFLTIALGGIGAIYNGWVRTVFFPEVPGQFIIIKLQMQNGSPESLTNSNIFAIEEAAFSLNKEIMQKSNNTLPPIAKLMTAKTGPLSAEIYAELQPESKRNIETLETLRMWRERVEMLEGTQELVFNASDETAGGFVIELGSRSDANLNVATLQFERELAKLEGVSDIRSDLKEGDPQIRLHLKREAQHLGITSADLATQIGDMFGGLEVQRLSRDGEEVKVYVKYTRERRRYMSDIYDTRIQTINGEWVPLSLVATIESGFAPSFLHRQDGRRIIEIKASLDKEQISPSEVMTWVNKELEPKLTAIYPDLSIKGGGELEEMGEIKHGLKQSLVVIAMLIFILLAVPLKSYWQPFIIMSVIPFGFIGAVIGHWAMDFELSILSFFGMLAVMGIVVNDSLVMLTRFNEYHRGGMEFQEALLKAGTNRFRPIFLTTVTTVSGLMPLMFETSEQAQYLIPAAISLAWGEIFATPITLMIIPVLIHIAHDIMENKTKGAY